MRVRGLAIAGLRDARSPVLLKMRRMGAWHRSQTFRGAQTRSRRLRDVPEERQRPLDDAAHVLAPGLVGQEEPGRGVDNVIEGGFVEPARRRLLLLDVAGIEPGGDLLLDLRNVGPAEPGAVAVGADGDVDRRVDAVRARVPRVEHGPAALAGGRFLRPALAGGAPVGGYEVDVHADALEQLRRDVA